jgi:hypothetical protein
MSDKILMLLGRLGFTASWRGLLRVAAWFLIGLLAIGTILPDKSPNLAADVYNRRAPNPWVRSITAARGDPRGFTPTTNDGVFKVAWVGGSESQQIGDDYSFLPMLVRDELPVVDGRPVSIDMYFVSGMRLVDQYAGVLAAIADDVDAIVVALNPVWSTTDLAIHGLTALDPELATHALMRPRAWPIALSLLRPSDLLWGEASRGSAAIDDRYQWGAAMQSRVDRWTLLPEPQQDVDAADEAELSELDRIRAMTSPLEFWTTYAPFVGPDVTGSARTAASFERFASSASGLNRSVLRRMGEAITDSGIPTLVYNAQVNGEILDDPLAAPFVATAEAALAGEADSFDAPKVIFRPQTLTRRAHDMVFEDIVHVLRFGSAVDVVTSDLCAVLTASGHQPECEAP